MHAQFAIRDTREKTHAFLLCSERLYRAACRQEFSCKLHERPGRYRDRASDRRDRRWHSFDEVYNFSEYRSERFAKIRSLIFYLSERLHKIDHERLELREEPTAFASCVEEVCADTPKRCSDIG